MLEPWRTGKVIKLEDETSSSRKFWIQIPEVTSFDFTPGQFVTLDLPIHEQKNKRWRSYSIASAPNGTNVIELIIVLLEGGLGTTYLFNQVEVGTEICLPDLYRYRHRSFSCHGTISPSNEKTPQKRTPDFWLPQKRRWSLYQRTHCPAGKRTRIFLPPLLFQRRNSSRRCL